MGFMENWKALQKYSAKSAERFLTIYLNTEPTANTQPEWKIRLKNGFKKLAEYTEAGEEKRYLDMLLDMQAKVEERIENSRTEMKKGLIIVTDSSGGLFFCEKVQTGVPNAFYFEAEPHLEELEAIMSRCPAAGIVQLSNDTVTIIDSLLCEIHGEHYYEWDLVNDEWRERSSQNTSDLKSAVNKQRENYPEQWDVIRPRWIKRLVPIIENMAKEKQWEEIILSGEKQIASQVKEALNTRISVHVVPKNLSNMKPKDVLQEAYAVLQA
ncbi:VLRF1 family aeRF1-type release factor [Paenibacillus hunanensis]|uniref:VLRF1 family aeRF1-type release factor n=1 Tax=Paenibacillus hunanensis TaxID=539262 RepID=UPI002A6B67B1|nr:VLRF1 family aeRF1-type release factor [Paenibacillus hunanensis]WPP41162.1 VLRF1 family aeRF1-type release factor [Paenibacillus hunanensis]